jgi:hypothetical protein
VPINKRSSLNTILAALANRLNTWPTTKIPLNRIKVVSRDPARTPMFDGDNDVLLRAHGFRADPDMRDRQDFRIYRQLDVVFRVRDERDETGVDFLWLTDPNTGAAANEDDLMDALQNFWAQDASLNNVLFAPPWITGGSDYTRASSKGAKMSWGEVTITMTLPITPPLTQTYT